MKTNLLTIICLLCLTMTAISQEVRRNEVSGQIISDHPDLEGVTVFNTSSNKGTITDKKGAFRIAVALNDRIQISALQFENFEVVISQDILDARSMTIFLVEQINKLDEVLILPYGLSGNLAVDVDNTKTLKPNLDALYFGMSHINKFEFADDYKSGVENIAARKDDFKYGTNLVKIAELLKPIFSERAPKASQQPEVLSISSKYSTKYLMERLSVDEHEIQEFLAFVESQEMDPNLLNDGKEFEFLDFIISKSKEFVKQKGARD